ncbi:hypothetical protein ACFQU7_04260 [Pseudoroseomonas wenyumeiae]
MQLTDEQVKAAEAQGCRFVEATEAQVRQFSMQRRVFQIGDKPYLATREDGFYETAGTLMARVAEVLRQQEASAPAEEPVAEEAAEVPQAEETAAADETPEAEAAAPAEEAAEPEAVPEADEAPEAAEPAPIELAKEAPAPVPATVPSSADQPSAVLSAMKTIAKGYARGHQVDAAQLSTLLTTVHRTLSGLQASQPRHPRSGPG